MAATEIQRCNLSILTIVVVLSVISMASIVSVSAQSQHPFAGRWHSDGPETCIRNYDGENAAIKITANQLFFYESTCDIRSTQKRSSSFYLLRLICRFGGEIIWRGESIYAIRPKDKLNEELLLRIEPRDSFVLAYKRCP